MIDIIIGGLIFVVIGHIGMKLRGKPSWEEEQELNLAREVRRLRNYSDY